MKKIILNTFTVLSLLSSCSTLNKQSLPEKIDTSRLSLVEENHAEIIKGGNTYILESYIILFEQPYYITIATVDKKPITKEDAITITTEYIKSRGCTEPLERRPNLDKTNKDGTQWLIGVAC